MARLGGEVFDFSQVIEEMNDLLETEEEEKEEKEEN